MQTQTNSPFASIENSLIPQLCKIAGLRYENGLWSILTQKCHYKSVVNGKISEVFGELPLAYYNFEYAMKVCEGDIQKALSYAESKLWKNGSPIFLPKQLNDNLDESYEGYYKILSKHI